MIDVISVIIVLFSVWEIKRTRRILSIERVNRAHCCGGMPDRWCTKSVRS
jgi:hypothetical protein